MPVEDTSREPSPIAAITATMTSPSWIASRRPWRAASQASTTGAATSGKPLVITASPSTARPARRRPATTSRRASRVSPIGARSKCVLSMAPQTSGMAAAASSGALHVPPGPGRQRAAEEHHPGRHQQRPAGEGEPEGVLAGPQEPRQSDHGRRERRVLEEDVAVRKLPVEHRRREGPVHVEVVDAVVAERRHQEDRRPADQQQDAGGQEQPPHAKTAWRSGSGSVAATGSSRIR